jgi:hypothetical protein
VEHAQLAAYRRAMRDGIAGWLWAAVSAAVAALAVAWASGLWEPSSTALAVAVAVGAALVVLAGLLPIRSDDVLSAPVPVPPEHPPVLATRLARRLIRKRGGAVWIWADERGLSHAAFRPPAHAVEFEDEPLGDGLTVHVAAGLVWPGRSPVLLEYRALPPRIVANVGSFRTW